MGPKEQEETEAQKAVSQHAMSLLQDYKRRWLPVQQRLAQTIENSGKKGSAARKLAAGKSSTDTAMSFDKSGGALEKALSNSGVSPGSSRSNLAITGMGGDAATSAGLGHMMSEQAVDDAYTQGLGALAAIGRGERASVGDSMSKQAANSNAQASSDAAISLAEREGTAGLIGQVGGFGLQQGMKGMSFGGSGSAFTANDPNGYGMNPTGIAGQPRGGA